MSVGGEDVPAHRVGARAELRERAEDRAPVVADARSARDGDALRRHDADLRQRDRLVEPEPHRRRRRREALTEARRGVLERRVRVRRTRERERDESCGRELLHRRGVPASEERWPKIGAMSRSV